LTQFIKIFFDDWPAFLEKEPIETIWARGLVQWEVPNNVVSFLFKKRRNQTVHIHRE
jgi:hypothetical protein